MLGLIYLFILNLLLLLFWGHHWSYLMHILSFCLSRLKHGRRLAFSNPKAYPTSAASKWLRLECSRHSSPWALGTPRGKHTRAFCPGTSGRSWSTHSTMIVLIYSCIVIYGGALLSFWLLASETTGPIWLWSMEMDRCFLSGHSEGETWSRMLIAPGGLVAGSLIRAG